MPVLGFAANESIVNFSDTARLFLRLYHRSTDFVAHARRRLIRTEANLPLNLECADSFLAGGHEVNDFEPLTKQLVGILENRSGDNGEPIAVRGVLLALPMPLARLQVQ